MINMKDGLVIQGEMVAQRIKMFDVSGHRVALWSIQDTTSNTVMYALFNTKTDKIVESDSLKYLNALYDACIQHLMMSEMGLT